MLKALRDLLLGTTNQTSEERWQEKYDLENTYFADAHPAFRTLYRCAHALEKLDSKSSQNSEPDDQKMKILTWDLPTDIDSHIEAAESCLLEIRSDLPFEQIYTAWVDSWKIIGRDGKNDQYFLCDVKNSSVDRSLCLCFAAFSLAAIDPSLKDREPIHSQVSNNAFFIVTYSQIENFMDGTLFRLMGYGISPQGINTLSPNSPTREISLHNFTSSTLDSHLRRFHNALDESLRSKYGRIEVIKHFFLDTFPKTLEVTSEGESLTPQDHLIQVFERYAESHTKNTKLNFSIAAANKSNLVIRCVGTLSSGSGQTFSESNTNIGLDNIAHIQVAQSEGHPCVTITLKSFVQRESQQKDYVGALSPTFRNRSHKILHERIECQSWEGAHQIKLALDAFILAQKPQSSEPPIPRRPSRRRPMD